MNEGLNLDKLILSSMFLCSIFGGAIGNYSSQGQIRSSDETEAKEVSHLARTAAGSLLGFYGGSLLAVGYRVLQERRK